MSSRSPKYTFLVRLGIISLAVTHFCLASLSSFIVFCAKIIRNQARSDLINTTNPIADSLFEALMGNIVLCMAVVASAYALCGISETLLAIHPTWLQDDVVLGVLFLSQLISVTLSISIGAWTANKVNGFQSSFAKFANNSQLPSYDVIYYGSLSEAVFWPSIAIASGFCALIIALMNALFTVRIGGERRDFPASEGTFLRGKSSVSNGKRRPGSNGSLNYIMRMW